jgi:hypothetical protein
MWPFSKSKKRPSNQLRVSQSWTLVCPRCGKRYVIGEDSILVSDENVMEDLFRLGARAIVGAGTRKPELVIYKATLSPELDWIKEREKVLENIQRIKQDLQQGHPRSWSCYKCSSGNAYPRD